MIVKGSAMIKVGILGATGYAGAELVQRLERHPDVKICFISSESSAGQELTSVFPSLSGCTKVSDMRLLKAADCRQEKVDAVFSCLPHTASAENCVAFRKAGARVIDLSGDFRLGTPEAYRKWYGKEHPQPGYLASAVYGLTEYARADLPGADLVANPGCYATSVLLPLWPLFDADAVGKGTVIADAKSGVSGSGRKLSLSNSYCEANEAISAYKAGRRHAHVGEITQRLFDAADGEFPFIFTPHLTPMNRGILSTLYVPLAAGVTGSEIRQILAERYEGEPFIKVLTEAEGLPSTAHVRGTNRCHIGVASVPEEDIAIVVSVIDNLVKGAAGQALQNFNAMFGFPEPRGLV